MEYGSVLTNELRTVVIHSRSVYSQTRLANFGYIPECKSKNPTGLNEISLLARIMGSIRVINFKEASGRFFFHFLEVFEKCIEYIRITGACI